MDEEIRRTLIDEKLGDNYSRSEKLINFVGESEITVTITLEEYRNLITTAVRNEYSNKELDYWKYYNENLELKKQIEQLNIRVQVLQEQICEMTMSSVTDESEMQ